MDATTSSTRPELIIGSMQIRQVVETYPETMVVFHEYGMDMCCGGAHSVNEAARLHEIEPEAIARRLLDVINHERL